MAPAISKDTVLCMSLAGRPSNIGTRFHNYLYEELGLDYIYKAFTTNDLAAAIGGIRALGIRGCGVSMPYKEACIEYVDELDDSARAIESVNTIVNTDGVLRAYNTDYLAVCRVLSPLSRELPFAVHGSGGMAKAVVAALRDSGFRSNPGVVMARNESAGRELADRYGYSWARSVAGARLLINATPIGMAGGADAGQLSFPAETVAAADTVFDVVAMPVRTPLIQLAESLGKNVITGAEVIMLQALEQFVLYTGIRPTEEQARRASEFSRGGPAAT